jgi:Uma2 family endonuclease
MTTAIQVSAKPAIEYPDDDGEPMADNTLQFKWIVVIKENLDVIYRDETEVFVAGNLLWYPVEGQPTIRIAPDAMVVFGRPKGRRGSYKQWEEGGVAPHVVFETLSPGNTPPEMERKRDFYERYGVEEYYVYDPDDGSFEAWLMAGSRLVKVESVSGFVSPRLQIRFEPGEGPDNLTIFCPDGTRFLTSIEFREQAVSDRLRAEEADRLAARDRQRAEEADRLAAMERQRAEEADRLAAMERQRAEEADRLAATERQRAEMLAAQLRELGIEPDSS